MYREFFSYLNEDEEGLKFDELKEKRFKNPETGKLIKIASALTYDHDREPYKMAVRYLRLYGIDYENMGDKDSSSTPKSGSADKSGEKEKTEPLMSVDKLYFRFDSNKKELKISNTSDREAPYITFDEGDGITQLSLLDKGEEKNSTKFSKPKFYKVADRYDVSIKRESGSYKNIKYFLSNNKKIFARKINKLKSDVQKDKTKEKVSLLSDLKDTILSVKKKEK